MLRHLSLLSWSCMVWGSDTAEYLISSVTQSTCVALYWAFVGGFTELKPFSALGKAPGLPLALARLTAWGFSAVKLRPRNSVRFKNEGNLKMYSGWHLPFDWPGSAGRAMVRPEPCHRCMPWTGAVLGGEWTRQEGRWHLAPPGKGSRGKHYGEAGEGKAMWSPAGGWGGAWSQWGEK